MATVPTGHLERELRKLYLQWVGRLSLDSRNIAGKIEQFQHSSEALIAELGGQTASLGALADFPVPKTLELSPYAGKIYNEMQQAAIQASITAGLNSKEAARAMFKAGMDKGYRKLERLARTETVSAYWKNQWDSTADLPLIVMVWGSESGPRTCDYCLSRDGLVVEDSNIRDHPNGRCTLVPMLRSRVKYKGTLQPDGSVDMDPAWADQKVKGARAQASAGPTTPEQRDPLSGKSNPAAPSVAQPEQSSKPAPQAPVTRTLQDPDVVSGMRAAEDERLKLMNTRYDKKGNSRWTNEENSAWNSYTSGGYQDINTSYRNPAEFAKTFEGDDFFKDKFLQEGETLSNLMTQHAVQNDITVVRGLTSTPGFDPATLKKGESFADPGFWSSSSQIDQAEQFMRGEIGASSTGSQGWLFVSNAPKGTHAIPGVSGQGEIIFKPGQLQRVVSVDPDNHIVYTEMF